jgi:hypothetical protein
LDEILLIIGLTGELIVSLLCWFLFWIWF